MINSGEKTHPEASNQNTKDILFLDVAVAGQRRHDHRSQQKMIYTKISYKCLLSTPFPPLSSILCCLPCDQCLLVPYFSTHIPFLQQKVFRFEPCRQVLIVHRVSANHIMVNNLSQATQPTDSLGYSNTPSHTPSLSSIWLAHCEPASEQVESLNVVLLLLPVCRLRRPLWILVPQISMQLSAQD